MTFCYHYDVNDEGACTRCGSPVETIPGHSVRVSFGDGESIPVWLPGAEPPTVVGALAFALCVQPSDVVLLDVAPDGDGWNRRMRARWTLRGSRVEVVAMVTVNAADKKEPERTEVDADGVPVEASAD